MPIRILTIVGARPQFIKAAVVSRAFASFNGNAPRSVVETLVHTGQHFDPNMSDVFFEEMHIPRPAHHLGVGGGSHGAMTGRMLEGIERIAKEARPDWVLVYGDTNSTLAGALAAAKLHVPVAHVEAGLRSFNRRMPEEINRVVTDHVADILFAPTRTAVENLEREGITGAAVHCVGDVMYDAALHYSALAAGSDRIQGVLRELRDGFHLASVHRAENTDDPARLSAIIAALEEIAARTSVVLPLHPRTRKALGDRAPAPGLFVLEPVGYFDMLYLLQRCRGVITDSGGLQKEAFFFRKRCLVLREETEWVELVDHGCHQLVGADRARITAAANEFLVSEIGSAPLLYGDGDAGARIVHVLMAQR